MKIQSTLLIALILIANTLFAQNARFATSGVIEFEKSVNMHAIMKRNLQKHPNSAMMSSVLDQVKSSQPQFKILKSTLVFSGSKTLFTPIEAEGSSMFDGFGASEANQPNTIYTDLATGSFIAQKKVFDETFLVKDSVRKINWKLTSELRTIAGYECRRANALIMDSVYVVAFYTDKIPLSGGPESFTGLPGMILGVALPHDNITWFAKTITDKPIADAQLKAPVKGKPVDNKSLFETMNGLLKKWGSMGNSLLKMFML